MVQQELMEYISYEMCEMGNKGQTIQGKLSAVDDWHIKNGVPPPFMVAFSAKHFLDEVKHMDIAPCPKAPVPAQLIELMALRKLHLRQEASGDPSKRCFQDDLVESAAASSGLWLLLRSKEYLKPDAKDFTGLRWGDITFKDAARNELQPHEVTPEGVHAATYSLISTKNSFGRCTRTLAANAENTACPVRLVAQLYQLLYKQTRRKPDPAQPVFQYADGTVMRRDRMSLLLREFIKACKLDSRLFASHSLRRGGCVVYHANNIPLETIKRMGRWESDAVLLYIHDTDSDKTQLMADCFKKLPKFELH